MDGEDGDEAGTIAFGGRSSWFSVTKESRFCSCEPRVVWRSRWRIQRSWRTKERKQFGKSQRKICFGESAGVSIVSSVTCKGSARLWGDARRTVQLVSVEMFSAGVAFPAAFVGAFEFAIGGCATTAPAALGGLFVYLGHDVWFSGEHHWVP